MANPRPTTIDEYIRAAPGAGQLHLCALHAILKRAAPKGEEAIKWGNLFFVEPRFVYAFSAHKAQMIYTSCITASSRAKSAHVLIIISLQALM